MANDIGNDKLSPQLWSARLQFLLKNSLVSGAIANTEERAGLKFGYRTHRPYTGGVYAMDYVRDTAPTFQDMVATDEYLDVDQAKIIPMYLDDIDEIQNKYDAMDQYVTRATYQMRNKIDQKVLSEVGNALLGNSTAFTLSTTNVFEKFSQAKAELFNNGCEDMKPWYSVVDGDTISLIEQTMAFNGFKMSDEVLEKGWGLANYLGDWAGLQMFRSQNLPTSVPVVFSDDPTTTHTLTVNGVTFTFIATLAGTAGQVLIDAGSDVDVTLGTNLVAAINGTAVGTKYVQLSAADRAKLAAQSVVAAYTAASNTLTITAAGKITLGGTQTTGVIGTQTMKLPIGQLHAIDLVVQEDVRVNIDRVTDGRQGQIATVFALYGSKMFREGAQRTYAMTITK